jgi:glucose/arabinose dehydrogenase
VTVALERVLDGLDFPTSLGFDADGRLWVTESGLPFAGAMPGGRLRCGANVVVNGLRPPVNGLLWHDDAWIVSEGGKPGRISRVDLRGERSTLVDDLPGYGDYQTNMVVAGPDGWLYFSQGAASNLGVAGLDTYDLGWVKDLPREADAPGLSVVVSGAEFETPDPRNPGRRARTGVFAPFGTTPGARRLKGRVRCTAAVLRFRPDGSRLELVAWGLRNAFGLLFLPDGRLLATDQGPDDRGSRPIGNAPDLLFEVINGRWYGFPDFVGGVPVDDPRFVPTRGPSPERVILNPAELPAPEKPLLAFPVNASATKLDCIPDHAPRYSGQLLVCLFGDERPLTGPAGHKVGRSVIRVNLADGVLHPTAAGPLRRPIDVRIHDGFAYVLDFGAFEMSPRRVDAVAGTGAVYRFPLSVL